jgi:FkbM family methyltransferase
MTGEGQPREPCLDGGSRFRSWERRVNEWVLGLPKGLATIGGAYGAIRGEVGLRLYRGRRCPVVASPARIVASTLRSGDVYIDVGANEGDLVVLASRAVGASGRILAFEPQKELADRLRRMAMVYQMSNVEVAQVVLGDRNGLTTFFVDPAKRSSASVSVSWHGGRETQYEMVRLDDWLDGRGVDRIDLVKIDVEGAELLVIRGGRKTLMERRPPVVLEIRDEQARQIGFGYRLADLFSELRSCGYGAFFCLRPDGLTEVSGAGEVCERDHDLLALEGQQASVLERLEKYPVRFLGNGEGESRGHGEGNGDSRKCSERPESKHAVDARWHGPN